jgi:hypothetical protein
MALETRALTSPSTTGEDLSFRLPSEEVNLLRNCHPNVLITGTPAATAIALQEISTCLRPPVERWRPGDAWNLSPVTSTKTLILMDAASMSPSDQERFLEWLRRNEGATQVITITPVPLYALVDRGAFSDLLYYYLNLVHFEVT